MRALLPALALGLAATGRAAPEFELPAPQQVDRAADPLEIEGNRFAFALNKAVKAQGRATFRWTLEEKPSGATVVAQPDPELLTRGETARDIAGFEVDRAGAYTLAVAVTDKTGTTERRVTVKVKNTLRLLTRALPPAVVGKPYEFRFHAQGGVPPHRFSLSGNPPAGLAFKDRALAGRPAVAGAAGQLTLTVTDAAGATASTQLSLRVSDKPLPWGMLNIGSSFTPHDDPLRALAAELGWDEQGWRLDRGGTLGVGVGYTWNNDLPQRWRMLDAIRSGLFASLFLHQGRPWGGSYGVQRDSHGDLTDLGALKAFFEAARDTAPTAAWPVYLNAYWRPESDVSHINASSRDYFTNGDAFDDTVLYYEGSLQQAAAASRLVGRPVYLIPIGPVMLLARRLVAAGKTPSLASVWDLFAGDGVQSFDGGHLSELGNTLFAQTYFAQTYGVDIRALPFAYKRGSDDFVLATDKDRKPIKHGTLTAAERRLFQELVQGVVTSDPFSGFREPPSLDAYLELARKRLGWWETFDTDITPISGDAFTGDGGRRWTGRAIRRNTGLGGPYSVEIAPGGQLATSVDRPFDLLFVETSLHHKEDWALEIYAGDKLLGALPAAPDKLPAAAQVAQWYLKDLRAKLPGAPFTLSIRNTGKRPVAVDNLKLRTTAEHGWMLTR